MKYIIKSIVILVLLVSPFTAFGADAATGLFGVQMKLALQGKPQDQYFLGVMYEEGLGSQPDLKSARMWYEKSAQQNYPLAVAKIKELDNPKSVNKFTTPRETDNLYETNPGEKVKVRESKPKIISKNKIDTSTKFSRQEVIAKKEIEKKRRAWKRAMQKQSKYTEDAFE